MTASIAKWSGFKAGCLLRANGRWSLTHLWRQRSDRLETKCGEIYEPEEVYADEVADEVFMDEPEGLDPVALAMTRCGGCFPAGTGRVIHT